MKGFSLIILLSHLVVHLFGQDVRLVLPLGHTKPVYSLTLSGDGKYVATASLDNIKIWEEKSGQLIETLVTDEPQSVIDFSGDNKRLVTVSDGGNVYAWNLVTSQMERIKKGLSQREMVYVSVPKFFSPDGNMFATIDTLNVRLWDTKTGKSLGQFQSRKQVWGMSFSTDGKRILTWGKDSTFTISDLLTNTAQLDLKYGGDIRLAYFSPDGEYVVIGYSNESIEVFESIEVLDSKSGKLITRIDSTQIVFKHFIEQESIVVDQESKYVIGKLKNSVKIWRLGSGELLHELAGHSTPITSIALSPDGKTIVTASGDRSAKVWDIKSGNIVNTLDGHSKGILDVIFNKNGDRIITASEDHTAKSWEFATGRLRHTMGGNFQAITEAAFTPDNSSIIIGYRNQDAKVWDCSVGKPARNMSGHLRNIYGVEFNEDGFTFVTTSQNETARVWNLRTGKLSYILKGHQKKVNTAQFTLDGNSIVTTSADGNVKIWDRVAGRLRYTLEGSIATVPNIFALSPDGKYIATSSDDKVALWDLGSGTLIRNISSNNGPVSFIAFHPKGGMIMTGCIGGTVKLSDINSGKLIRELKAGFDRYHSTGIFSRNGAQIITSYKDSIQFWDTESAKILRIIPGQRLLSFSWEPLDYNYYSPQFRPHDPGSSCLSPDGKYLITTSIDRTINIWDLTKYILVKSVSQKGFLQEINWATRKLLFNENSVLTMVDLDSGNELLSFICIGEADWVVTHPSGLFDASPSAMEQLYFAQGLDLINFKQLKERYFEPDLWKRVVENETLRSVEDLKSVELPPDIVASVDEQGFLNVRLKNKGGGIGEVNVFVNGKEILRDARQDTVSNEQDSLQIKLFIAKNRNIIKGQENIIGIKAWNNGHWVVSRGELISYNSKEIESYKPAIHILSCGISNYTGEEIDLKYAAKDAEDMTKALQLGARQLFGVQKSYVYSLTTNQTKEEYPTKKNILKALEKISAKAHPLDVFILYLSGHGINYGGQDGDWYYLTQDAYTAGNSAYGDPAIKNMTTLSSNELVEQVKKIAALKQVLIIDACASGKVLDNFMARKDLPSSTLRSLDRMKDRTGMHIITGSTADEVSYEASKYSQGVLTYSLLEAMRGAALRENQYIDVNILFQYAQDRVPLIAEGIGGIQSPRVFSPQGSQSFDIGLLSESDKRAIPIAIIKPVYIRSNFQDENELEDVINLGKAVDDALRETSAKGFSADYIFVDVREYPEGCKLIGRYSKEIGRIKLKLRKRCGQLDETIDLEAGTVEELRDKIMGIL